MTELQITAQELTEIRYARERKEHRMHFYDRFTDEYHLARYN